MDFSGYSDRSRFADRSAKTRYYVLQGFMGRDLKGRGQGTDWHIVLETPDLDRAWGSRPTPGLVVSREELLEDPVIASLLEDWERRDDEAFHRFVSRWPDGWLDQQY